MKLHRRNLQLMNGAMLLGALGGSLTWAGLPLYTAQWSGNFKHVSLLFICETLGGLLFTLWGGKLSDHFSRKKLSIYGPLTSGLSLFVLLAVATFCPGQVWPFYVVGLVNAILGSLSSVSQSLWYNSVSQNFNPELETILSKKNALLITAKTVGFTLGPLLYLTVGKWALAIDGLLSLIEAGLLTSADEIKSAPSSEKKIDPITTQGLWPYLKQHKKLWPLIGIQALSGALSLPVLQMALSSLAQKSAPKSLLSLFWLLASLGSFCSNQLMIRTKLHQKFSKFSIFLVSNLLLMLGLIFLSGAQTPWAVITLFPLYTLTNPVINNLATAELYRQVAGPWEGRLSGVSFALGDASALGVLLLFSFYGQTPFNPLVFLALIPLIIWRVSLSRKIWIHHEY